jgi:hypothetical protein
MIDSLALGREHVVLAQLAGYKDELRRSAIPTSGLLRLELALVPVAAAPSPARRPGAATRAAAAASSPRPSPAAAPAAPPPRPVATSGAPGRLLLASQPWAEAIVDGKPQGATPLGLSLPPGSHTVVLVSSQLHQSKTFTIVVNPGETVRKKVSFSDP